MVEKPRTIDNMGIETSARYARDKAALEDSKLVEESRFIPLKTEVSVVKPYLPTNFEEYLMAGKVTSWAAFAPPPGLLPSAPLFSHQLVPSLGGYEKQEADEDKLNELEGTLKQLDPHESFEDEKQRKTILALLKQIGKLDLVLSMINARRNQYHRG